MISLLKTLAELNSIDDKRSYCPLQNYDVAFVLVIDYWTEMRSKFLEISRFSLFLYIWYFPSPLKWISYSLIPNEQWIVFLLNLLEWLFRKNVHAQTMSIELYLDQFMRSIGCRQQLILTLQYINIRCTILIRTTCNKSTVCKVKRQKSEKTASGMITKQQSWLLTRISVIIVFKHILIQITKQ